RVAPRKEGRSWLQFGHDEFAVESPPSSAHRRSSRRLQFGHDEFAVESWNDRRVTARTITLLQFGHDEFAVESIPLPELRSKSKRIASIRPRRIRRGERRTGPRQPRAPHRFNSATTNSP